MKKLLQVINDNVKTIQGIALFLGAIIAGITAFTNHLQTLKENEQPNGHNSQNS